MNFSCSCCSLSTSNARLQKLSMVMRLLHFGHLVADGNLHAQFNLGILLDHFNGAVAESELKALSHVSALLNGSAALFGEELCVSVNCFTFELLGNSSIELTSSLFSRVFLSLSLSISHSLSLSLLHIPSLSLLALSSFSLSLFPSFSNSLSISLSFFSFSLPSLSLSLSLSLSRSLSHFLSHSTDIVC